ncbi:MAG: GGDEF domain-containing protein [Spirochaetales bacterium]|nr:GGDEF domain-containing protein [Spirochaetales bacterium]
MDDLMLNLIKDPYKPENAVILPLRTEDGLTAILYLARLNETEYTEVDMHFFQVLANRLSIDLENYFLWKKKDRALKQLEEERNKLEVLNKELSRKNREIECINERLKMSSRTDPLTGIYNRRVLFEYLEDAVEKNRLEIDRTKMMKKRGSNILPVRRKNDKGQFQNYYKQFSVALIDIDYFKYINDFHGHLAGDDVLRTIGVLLKDESILRLSDIPGRYGGEEFLIIFPDTRCYESINSLKRFYEGLNNQKFKGRNNQRFKITVSIGMSDFEPEDTEAVHVIDRADKALYHAKHNGRNRVSIHDDGTNYYELEFG